MSIIIGLFYLRAFSDCLKDLLKFRFNSLRSFSRDEINDCMVEILENS